MMSLTWYLLGLLTVASGEGLRQVNLRYKLDWIAWGGLFSGIGALLFCIAWAMGAYLEGVPRAAAMGLLMFGLGGIVILAVVSKYINARLEKRVVIAAVTPAIGPAAVKSTPVVSGPLKTSVAISPFEKQIWSVLGRLAYLSLVIAFFLGLMTDGKDYETMLHLKFPEAKLTKLRDNPTVFRIGAEGSGNYALIQEGQGYGGPFVIGLRIMEDAKIHEVVLFDNKETPAFLDKIEKANFPAQFAGKHVTDDFLVGCGCRCHQRCHCLDSCCHDGGAQRCPYCRNRIFQIETDLEASALEFWPWRNSDHLDVHAGVCAEDSSGQPLEISLHGRVVGDRWFLHERLHLNQQSLWLGLGFHPTNERAYRLVGSGDGQCLVCRAAGKNVYCYRICPFFWVEWLLNKIGGSGVKLSPELQLRSRYVANACLWAALMLVFLSTYPGLGNYEPFAMMFSLDGVGVQWYLLPLALVGSFFLSSFWCRFFCPVGYSFSHLLSWRRRVLDKFKTNEKSKEA